MRHTHAVSKARPRPASLLEVQQKVIIVSAAIDAFGSLADALSSWFALFERD